MDDDTGKDEEESLGDTIYSSEPDADPAAAAIVRDYASGLTDTSKAERMAMKKGTNRNERPPEVSVVVNVITKTARGVAKTAVRGGVEALGNFDAILGAFSYSAIALAAAYFERGLHREGWIFGVLALVLTVAKHRASPGWIIDILKRENESAVEKIEVNRQKVETTFKG